MNIDIKENNRYTVIYKCQNCNEKIRYNNSDYDKNIDGIIDSFIKKSDKDFAIYRSFNRENEYKFYHIHKCNDGSIGFAIPIKVEEELS